MECVKGCTFVARSTRSLTLHQNKCEIRQRELARIADSVREKKQPKPTTLEQWKSWLQVAQKTQPVSFRIVSNPCARVIHITGTAPNR